jgi:predicted nucleic acid-binding Zn ribbon protein
MSSSTHPSYRFQPRKGVVRLDERDGELFYQGRHLGKAVKEVGFHYLQDEVREAIGDPTLHVYAVYQCTICQHWAAGSGQQFCSVECKRTWHARRQRERRAAVAAAAPVRVMVCEQCGADVAGVHASRRFCNNRCRQTHYRRATSA